MATSKRERQKAARREKMARREREQRRRRNVRRGVIVAIIGAVVIASAAFLFSGSTTPTTTTTTSSTTTEPTTTTTENPAQITANATAVSAGCPASPYTRVNNLSWKAEPPITITKTQPLYAHVTSTAGDFVIQLLPADALHTVNSFVFLAEHKYFNCVIFHRVVKDFVIQGGDPTGTGEGGPGYTLPDEYPAANTKYPLYSVAMANTGSPHTGGSQFFIVTGPTGEALPDSYSLFGQVVSGIAAIKAINADGSPTSDETGTPTVVQRMLTVTISSTP